MRSCTVLLLVLGGCTEPTLSPDSSRSSPLAIALAQQPAEVEVELLDLRDDGAALWGRPRPAPERATVMPLYDSWLVAPDGRRVDLPDGGVVRDARFGPLATGWIALLDRGHVLQLWNPEDGRRIEVSVEGFPGVSFSADGRALVYAAGPRPELELYLFDLESQVSRQVTHLETPLALPAFAADAGAIVFASALGGVPALWVIGRDGAGLRQLTNRDLSVADFQAGVSGVPMPEGRRPPLWHGSAVVFEAQGGVFAVEGGCSPPLPGCSLGTFDSGGTLVWALSDADLPHQSTDGQLWVRTPGGVRAVAGAAR